MNIVIGSRGSQLALWQANWVKGQLTAAGHEVAIEIIRTTGDKLQSFLPAIPSPPLSPRASPKRERRAYSSRKSRKLCWQVKPTLLCTASKTCRLFCRKA